MTTDHAAIELIVKVDWDDVASIDFMTKQQGKWPFTIKVLTGPRLAGFFSLWVSYDEALQVSDPTSYFVSIFTDETRCETPGWDRILDRYRGLFPDHIFRLRISPQKFMNYYEPFTCLAKPENFPIFTRKWLIATEGVGDSKGPDGQHQLIAFYLGMGLRDYRDLWRIDAQWRDVPVIDMEFSGMNWALDIPQDEHRARLVREHRELNRLNRYPKQLECNYLAKRLYLCILAHKQARYRFRLTRDEQSRTVRLFDVDQEATIAEVSYHLPYAPIYVSNARRRIRVARTVWHARMAGFARAVRNHGLLRRTCFTLGIPTMIDASVLAAGAAPIRPVGRRPWHRARARLAVAWRTLRTVALAPVAGGAIVSVPRLAFDPLERLAAICPSGAEDPDPHPAFGWFGLKWLLYPFSAAAQTAYLGYPLGHKDEVAQLPRSVERVRSSYRDAEFRADGPDPRFRPASTEAPSAHPER